MSLLPTADFFDGLCFISLDVNVGRIFFNDSALRWINDLALLSTVFVIDDGFGGSTFAAATTLTGGFGCGAVFVNFAMEYGDIYVGFFRPRITFASASS